MYTPKRQQRSRLEDSLIGKQNSPFSTLNLSVTEDSVHTRKLQSKAAFQIIEQDESHQLLTYGNALPVEVAEVLAASQKAPLSAKIDPAGWVSVVCGRKLFIWRFTSSAAKKAVSCFEFQLAPTELTHQADLTCVIETNSSDPTFAMNTKTSVMNVSPEGTVKFWQNINRPAVTVESFLNLGGKQCLYLLPLSPYGCVLVTTTNEVYILSPSISTVHCRQLTTSKGMLSNIGRRVSSFWSQPVVGANKYPPCICSGTNDYDTPERHFYTITNQQFQKWEIAGPSESETKMVYEIDLLKCIKMYTNENVESFQHIDEIQVLDMKNAGFGTMLLMVLWSGDTYRCAVGLLKARGDDTQVSFSSIVLIDDEVQEEDFTNLKLALPVAEYHVFIASKHMIYAQSVSKSMWNPVKVEFNKVNSAIIGVGNCGSDPIFLSRRHGLITLRLMQDPAIALMKSIQQPEKAKISKEQSKTVDIPLEISPSNAYATIKTAFVAHSKDGVDTNHIISTLECTPQDIHDAVIQLSIELLNSRPVSDPRWAAQRNIGLVTTSVLLLNQLQDKEQIHAEFIEFLTHSNIYEKTMEKRYDIQFEVNENSEKLQCMLALQNMYSRVGDIIDETINTLNVGLSTFDEENNFNAKDVFFANVTGVGQFFFALLRLEEKKLSQISTVKEQVELISTVSELFATCYTAAWQHRQVVTKQRQATQMHHVPWTGSATGINNRALLKRQIQLALEQGLPNVDSTKVGAILTCQVILLSDLLLDGYERELALLRSTGTHQQFASLDEEYQQERQCIVILLVELSYYEEAATLAEKYEDFLSLILLCEKTQDTEKLEHYKQSFGKQGFSEVLYQRYMDTGAWGKLMGEKDTSDDFDKFLGNYNNLSWLHFIGAKEFSKASHVLKHLSGDEKTCAPRKRLMLVLSNLSMLASDEETSEITAHVNGVDKHLELLEYQDNIMEFLGKGSHLYPPLPAEELIQMCLTENPANLTDDHYAHLFGLLSHVETDAQNLALDVWCNCILHDNWGECSQLDYADVVTQKMFFRCLKYCKNTDSSLSLIPSLRDLMSLNALKIRSTQASLRQLKACYEVAGLNNLIEGV